MVFGQAHSRAAEETSRRSGRGNFNGFVVVVVVTYILGSKTNKSKRESRRKYSLFVLEDNVPFSTWLLLLLHSHLHETESCLNTCVETKREDRKKLN